MQRNQLRNIHIQNYGCLKDVRLELRPLHALIGPNDSGKSTILMALRTLTTLAAGPISMVDDSGKLSYALNTNNRLSFEVSLGPLTWRLSSSPDSGLEEAFVQANGEVTRPLNLNWGSELLRTNDHRSIVAGSRLLRLEPDALRQPTNLIQEGQALGFTNALGLGLPAVYDAIISRDLPAYIAITKQLTNLFPTVKSLSLKNPSSSSKALGIQLADGTFVGADFMSEGMLYYLAYAALPYLEPTAVILIEEPENGLHPARVRGVMEILREISRTTQVIIATHSPLVINELKPDEVTVVTRDPAEGTKATLMKDTPNFAERSEVYALGELWLSYADGGLETPLFTSPEPTPDPGEPVEWSESHAR